MSRRRTKTKRNTSGKMKVGIGLRLQEAWRSNFESKPTVQNSVKTVTINDGKQISESSSIEKSSSSLPVALPDSGNLGYRDECITVDARLNKKGEWVLMKYV